MRVAIDGKCLVAPRAGVARYVEGLLGALGTFETGECDIRVLRPARATRTLPWTLVDLQRASGRGHDLLHLPFYYGPLWPRCPVTVAIHDILPIEHPEWFPASWRSPIRWLMPRTVRHAVGVVTFAHATAAAIAARFGVSASRIRVIPHGLDPAAFAPPGREEVQRTLRRHALDSPFVLQVGALEPRRGTDLAISAVARLRGRVPGVELVLAGELRAPVAALAAAPPWVRRAGRVDDADLPALYAAAAAVVAPSRGEGFDLPVLEALACGAVVVASDIDVHVEHFAAAVELFESGRADSLGAALERVMTDSVRREALRRDGPRHAARFRWADAARAHLQLWREIVAG